MRNGDSTGKMIIFSAPSGSGKTTLVRHLLDQRNDLEFSISCTTRPPRGLEKHGIDYYFLSTEEFKKCIENEDFAEWEEVYSERFYGTPHSEIERIWRTGKNVIFDIDVVGGINLKKKFREKALSIFVKPPDLETLGKRLSARNTDSPEDLKIRIDKAAKELTYQDQFDCVIVNDDLDTAKKEIENKIEKFLKP
ncbi:guanylate kinase [Candidatus Ornithobacterium hominis]|uniref:guanylate kinase n=1 Tax=Candidatus Ornithobacterium hominis TaxID=2497989 RepID=UPI0024BCA3C3|nr:guanylate kinase [Candidatus Ornithobacterium hominis]CAI9429223.1 guanylate kinase [Candidatus Ornithobacterium hominis]